jgi:hypothetical protein
MVVDYDGRVLVLADPGPGEKGIVGPIDLPSLRAERARRRGHHLLGHLRMEVYSGYRKPVCPGSLTNGAKTLTFAGNEEAIAISKARLV